MHSASIINENASEVVDDVIKLHVRRSSRTKHHKSKTKHHKDKRKKRRHSKNVGEDVSTGLELSECTNENTLEVQNDLVEIRDLTNCETTIVSELDAKLKLSVESFGINTKNVESATTKTEHVDSVRFINDVHNTANKDTRCDAKFVGASDESVKNALEDNRITKLQFNDATALPFPKRMSNTEDLNKDVEDVEYLLDPVPSANDSMETQVPNAPDKENKIDAMHHVKSQEHKDATLRKASRDSELKNTEDRKLKRKRKRPRHDAQVEENSTRNSSENNAINEAAIFKHRKKKHRHTNEHKTKKHHDVRKAPQDGIVVQEEGQKVCAQEVEPSSTGGAGRNTEDADGIISEPQRLAIKIKLCQECNSRHLQDACPLMTPQYTIEDTITYEDWLNKHKENTEVIKAIKSEDPMSEGYGRLADDSFESDEESLTSNEQCKTKSKVQREEKQLIVDTDRPLYARESLPDCLELRITNTDHGLGIYAKNMVPMYSKLGPLIGTSVREMDIPDDFSMRHIWEVLSLFRFTVMLLRYACV